MKTLDDTVTPATQAKIDAWRRQHAALDAPAYRLSFVARRDNLTTFVHGKERGSDGTERCYSADEVEHLIPFCSAKNLAGYEVYVTPISDDWHYLVVDDLNSTGYEKLINTGYRPSLVIESSPGNRQAILKTSKAESSPAEQSAANKVMQTLNKTVGDPNFSGAVHGMRMAGFANKKPGKNNPFVKIIEATGETCQRTAERLDMAREWLRKQRAEQPVRKSQNGVQARSTEQDSGGHASISGAADEYRRRTGHLPSSADWSAVDFGTAFGMIEAGWSRSAVKQAIIEASPGLSERHPDTITYTRRTLDAVERARAGG